MRQIAFGAICVYEKSPSHILSEAMSSYRTMCRHMAICSHVAMYSPIAMYSHITILPFPISPYCLILYPFATSWVTGFLTERASYPSIQFIPLLHYPRISLISRPSDKTRTSIQIDTITNNADVCAWEKRHHDSHKSESWNEPASI